MQEPSSPSWLRRQLSYPNDSHWLVLLVCMGMLIAAFLINPHPHGEGLAFFDVKLPPMCGFQMGTGHPCPGCGLTRSWVFLAHGDLVTSFSKHRLGWLTMIYVFAQAIRHGLWLGKPNWRKTVNRWGSHLDKGLIFLGIALVVNWLPTMFGFFT